LRLRPERLGLGCHRHSPCTLAVCTAPGQGGHAAQVIGPAGIALTERGKGTNTRYINNIAMEDRDVADSLLVTEVFTPAGHWSSYPPHRHDEDDYPDMTYLEETYYHRLNPAQGFGIQRVFTEDGSLDETMAVADHDVVLVPRGTTPAARPTATRCTTSTSWPDRSEMALPQPSRPRLDLPARQVGAAALQPVAEARAPRHDSPRG
jgi:5-deoxy-D-glucuronate isomerase